MTRQELGQINRKKLDREQRGKLLYKSTRIVQTPQGLWRVTSQSNTNIQYIVKFK